MDGQQLVRSLKLAAGPQDADIFNSQANRFARLTKIDAK